MNKLSVVIGRFQPFHLGHEYLLKQAAEGATHLLVLIGSAEQARTPKNPFTANERAAMIRTMGVFPGIGLSIQYLHDFKYNEPRWLEQVQEKIEEMCANNDISKKDVTLVGHEKDSSSYYLKVFPQYKQRMVDFYMTATVFNDRTKCMDATRIRQLMFENEFSFLRGVVSERVLGKLADFSHTSAFEQLQAEYYQLEAYKKSWAAAPYAPTFVTADAIVFQSGHVLLVQRRNSPGKGLWALPGGFVNQNERIRDAALRELKEETSIKLQDRILNRCVVDVDVFDAPDRSLRGRTITHVVTYKLDDSEPLPHVKPADDAIDCRWFTISQFRKMREQMFEDHYEIIDNKTAFLSQSQV